MFKRIYFFFLTYIAAMTYSQTLLMLWFFQNGISYAEMLIYFFTIYFFVFIFYFILENRKFSSRFSLLLGILCSAIGVLLANFIPVSTYLIYVLALFFALNFVFFWTIYNALHFKYSEKHERGFKSGVYFLLFPVLGAILSPISGLIVGKFGFSFLFLSSMFLYIIPIILISYLPNFDFKFETHKAFSEIEYPFLIIFQGYISMLTWNIIPIFTLFFITTPFKLGSFFGYLSVFAALAALLNSKISDKLKKRASFFYTFNILNVFSYIPLVFSNSLIGWQLFSGINNFTFNLTGPFNMTLTLDHAKNEIVTTMLGREIYLNFGRIFMIIFILFIYFITNSWQTALLYSALIPVFYPIIAYYQRVYLTR